MNILPKKKIVLLGMMSQMPVGGHVWLVVQYLIGFQRLGYDVYYVEAHGRTPRELMRAGEDPYERAAGYVDEVLRRFDLGSRWAYHAVHGGGRVYGMSEARLTNLYRSAELIINLHGGTVPLPEHYATGRLVYLGTDPGDREVEVSQDRRETIDLLEPHCAFFTWGLNYGNPDCLLPVCAPFPFQTMLPPVVVDFWEPETSPGGDTFTTVGNWRQTHRQVEFGGQVYAWSKHSEFMKFLDLPSRTRQRFELALSSYEDEDRLLLESHGWRVRPAYDFSRDLDDYRDYLRQSRGEFTAAKEQNVRLRSGWFSERSAQYLAAGRPVITQETGFSNVLPTGQGLFGFRTLEEAVAAVEEVNADYEGHSHAAAAIAREYFNYDVTLKRMLEQIECSAARPAADVMGQRA